MTAVLPTGIMEFNSDLSLRVGGGSLPKQEHGGAQNCSSQAIASAWGKQASTSPVHKRKSSNGSNEAPQKESEEDDAFPMRKKIKTEPKDDYELAEEECARHTVKNSSIQTETSATIAERWKYEQIGSASPVFERSPSFAADECHLVHDNCKQCVINEARQANIDSVSLHRRRQIREFEQGREEPLSNKIRVWKEKRLEKSNVVRGLARTALRMEEEGFYHRIQDGEHDGPLREIPGDASYERDDPRGQHVMQHDGSREHIVIQQHDGSREQIVVPQEVSREHIVVPQDVSREHGAREQLVITSEHHVAPRSRMGSHNSEEDNGSDEQSFGCIRYLLTHNGGSGSNTLSPEGDVEKPRNAPPISPGKQTITMAQGAPSMPVVLTSPGVVPQEYMGSMGSFPRVSLQHSQSSAAKASKVAKKRLRQQVTGSNFLERLGKGRHDSPTMAGGKNKANRKSFENCDSETFQNDLNRGQFGQGSTIVPYNIEPAEGNQEDIPGEQYISDIQRPYCNIPDDHQVTHINGVMSLPATRETRYGITLGELKRRTGFPEYLTRVDLIAYVRQSKSAGRALLDKYSISTAGQKSRPTILSKMCENEARVLGDGICRMNTEYFPWKTLARVASTKVVNEKEGEGKIEQKLKAIQNTRTMLKEMYDLMVENKDIACMKTFEVASHTFGTANILNHLTVFDRLFAEYRNNLLLKNNCK